MAEKNPYQRQLSHAFEELRGKEFNAQKTGVEKEMGRVRAHLESIDFGPTTSEQYANRLREVVAKFIGQEEVTASILANNLIKYTKRSTSYTQLQSFLRKIDNGNYTDPALLSRSANYRMFAYVPKVREEPGRPLGINVPMGGQSGYKRRHHRP